MRCKITSITYFSMINTQYIKRHKYQYYISMINTQYTNPFTAKTSLENDL